MGPTRRPLMSVGPAVTPPAFSAPPVYQIAQCFDPSSMRLAHGRKVFPAFFFVDDRRRLPTPQVDPRKQQAARPSVPVGNGWITLNAACTHAPHAAVLLGPVCCSAATRSIT